MNSQWTRAAGAALAAPFAASVAALAALALLSACGGSAADRRDRPGAAAPGSGAEQDADADAERLGEEALRVMDDVMAYGTSRRRLPASLREAGIDSLTGTTARWYAMENGRAVVWVAYRDQVGHAIVACAVDRQSLEDRGLAQGGYRARCRDSGGAVTDRLIGALE